MKIIACIKQVPDTAAKVTADGGKVSWGDAPLVINPWDEYAVEAALRIKEAGNATVTAITIGGDTAPDALKHALAMGCDDAILIKDPALANADTQAIAQVLAAAIKKLGGELAFFGREAVDGNAGIVTAQTARVLGWPALSLASTLKLEGVKVTVERSTEEGRQTVSANMPAAISLVKDYGEPRYPSFMGIRKASKAVIPAWTLGDLGLAAPSAVVSQVEIVNPPARDVNCEIISGASPDEIADKLADKILAEKVL